MLLLVVQTVAVKIVLSEKACCALGVGGGGVRQLTNHSSRWRALPLPTPDPI